MAEACSVVVKHYHADNGRFTDNGFINHCWAKQQNISYYGINTHFQNGIAEKKICDLQEQTHTMMLYAINKWREMVTIHLWPYGLQMANDVQNSTVNKGSDMSPTEIFTGVRVQLKLRHLHIVGCPMFMLGNGLQSQQNFFQVAGAIKG